MKAADILLLLKNYKFFLADEKVLQEEIYKVLCGKLPIEEIKKEHFFNTLNKVDFFLFDSIAVEVKINGQKRAIYKQCERYCGFEEVKELLLVTNVAMGFPEQINGKDCYVLSLGKAWL